jgi:hypothetical protein
VNDRTFIFLSRCKAYGIKRVAIGVADRRIKTSVDFVFGGEGSAFQSPIGREYNGWPAIWQAAEDVRIRRCGNHGQTEVANWLDDGFYDLTTDAWMDGRKPLKRGADIGAMLDEIEAAEALSEKL